MSFAEDIQWARAMLAERAALRELIAADREFDAATKRLDKAHSEYHRDHEDALAAFLKADARRQAALAVFPV
jgi:hypothetical protein